MTLLKQNVTSRDGYDHRLPNKCKGEIEKYCTWECNNYRMVIVQVKRVFESTVYVYLYVCIYVYIYIYIYIYVCMYICMYLCVCEYVCTYIYMSMCMSSTSTVTQLYDISGEYRNQTE